MDTIEGIIRHNGSYCTVRRAMATFDNIFFPLNQLRINSFRANDIHPVASPDSPHRLRPWHYFLVGPNSSDLSPLLVFTVLSIYFCRFCEAYCCSMQELC